MKDTFGKTADQEIRDPGERIDRGRAYHGLEWWSSCGYLPHFDDEAAHQHVTIHLSDSLPRSVVVHMQQELEALPPAKQDAERRKRVQAWLDAGHGCCALGRPDTAAMVEKALDYFHEERYRLNAWVVMPNHLHVLFQPMNGWGVKKIVASWKKYTAKMILAFPENAGLRAGGVWHPDFWDRFIRNKQHFEQVVDYIHDNPVKAGLCGKAEEWMWSSARKADQEIRDPGGDGYSP